MDKDTTKEQSGEKVQKVLSGTVVSNSMKDTVVVRVDRFVKHPKYGKFIRRKKQYKAHDAGNSKAVGDKVSIIATRPISKDKHFRILTNEQSE